MTLSPQFSTNLWKKVMSRLKTHLHIIKGTVIAKDKRKSFTVL